MEMKQHWPEYRLLTHRVQGLGNYRELMLHLTEAEDAIKVFCEVAPLP